MAVQVIPEVLTMDQRFMLAISCHHIEDDPLYNKVISKKGLVPIGSNIGFLSANANITLKFRNPKGELIIDDNIKMQLIKNLYCLKTDEYILTGTLH